MPRVPMLNGPSLEPRGAPSSAPNLLSGSSALGTAVQQVGGAIEQQAGKVEAKFQKEAREAEAVIGADADLELDSRLEAVKAETFKLKGLSASEGRAKAVELAAKSRADVAATIKSEAERNRFLTRSATAVMAARRQIEHYVGSEYDAHRQGVVKATEESAIAKAQSGVLDPAEFSLIETNAIRTIRETQRSEEEGTQRIADFQSRTAAGYTQGLLAQGRVSDAVQYVEKSRATLGARYPEAKALVDRANAGAEKDRLAGEVATLVDTSAEAVRTPDGYVTEEELRKAVPVEGYEGRQRDQVEAELRQRIQLERDRFKSDNNKHRDNVNRSDLPGNPRAGDSEVWLEKYDPDFLLARQARKQAQYERWLARQNGTPAQRSAAAKQQADDDKTFRYRLKRRLTEDPNVNPADVEVEFIADMKKKYGRDVAISQPELERGGAMSADAQKRATSKDSAADKANGARVEKAVVAAIKRGLAKGEKVDPTALNDEVGRDLLRLEARIEANGGKPLTETQWSDFEEEITRELTIEKPGRIYGTNTVPIGRAGQQPVYGPPAPPPKPTATPKQVKSYVVSPDKKQRRPRYSDGTLGPLEQVP